MAAYVHINQTSNFTGNESDVWQNQTSVLRPVSPYHSVITVYIMGFICIAFAVTGVLFNTLTIVVISKGQRIGKQLKFQLVNLAVADLVTAGTFPIYLMYRLLRLNFPLNDALCKFIGLTSIWPNFVSLLWNMIISIERLLVIYFPLRMRHYSLKWKIIVAVLVWGIGFALRSNSLVNSRVRYLGKISICYVGESSGFWGVNRGLDEIINMATYGIPAIAIIVCYTMICFKLYMKPKIGHGGSQNQEDSAARHMTQVSVDPILLLKKLQCSRYVDKNVVASRWSEKLTR